MKELISVIVVFIGLSGYTNAQWQPTNGPAYTDISCLTVNGTDIFAATSGGGVFFSSDSGNNWTAKNNGLTNFTIVSICVSGSNVFASTTYDGVFVSNDYGTSWNFSGLSGRVIISSFAYGNNVYIGTRDNGIFLSTDAGVTWNNISGGTTFGWVFDFGQHGNTLFVCGGFGLFKTDDNGTNWTSVTEVNCGETYNIAVDGDYILGLSEDNMMFRSTNGGLSWSVLNTGIGSKSSLAVKGPYTFLGTASVLAPDPGVFLSCDSGMTWTKWDSAGLNNYSVWDLAINGNCIYAGTTGGGVWKRSLSDITGIENIGTNGKMTVYPDPAKDYIIVDNITPVSKGILSVCNIHGQFLMEQQLTETRTKLDISRLAKGVYFVTVVNSTMRKITKFVKE